MKVCERNDTITRDTKRRWRARTRAVMRRRGWLGGRGAALTLANERSEVDAGDGKDTRSLERKENVILNKEKEASINRDVMKGRWRKRWGG